MEILLRVDDMLPAEVKIVTLLKRKEKSPPVSGQTQIIFIMTSKKP